VADSPSHEPKDEPVQERGVQNPKVVDLIARDESSGAVVLTMIEQRPWGAVQDQIRQIEDKFNSYLGYVKGGMLERQYPQYAGATVVFRLECAEPPGPQESGFLEAVANFAADEEIRFDVEVAGTPATRQ
jgi:hypothetical protein